MKTKSYFNFFAFLLLLFATFSTSCTQQLIKTDSSLSGAAEVSDITDVKNLTKEAFNLYHHDQLKDAIGKLESTTSMFAKDTPKSTAASVYALLTFLQEKSGDSDKAKVTFELVKNYLKEISSMPVESETLGAKSYL